MILLTEIQDGYEVGRGKHTNIDERSCVICESVPTPQRVNIYTQSLKVPFSSSENCMVFDWAFVNDLLNAAAKKGELVTRNFSANARSFGPR